MIRTGLPYDFDLMETIEKEGAVVDVSQVSYPNSEDIERTTLIYLRNTNYDNIVLDFSKVDYKTKEKYLIEYLTGDIEHPIKQLTESWFSLFMHFKQIPLKIDSILDSVEEMAFFKENGELMKELDIFAYSLLLYPISRLDTLDFEFDFSNIENSDLYLT